MKIDLTADVYNVIMCEVDINMKNMREDVKYIEQDDENINVLLNDFSIRKNETKATCYTLIKILEPNVKGENAWYIKKMLRGLCRILDEIDDMMEHLYYS